MTAVQLAGRLGFRRYTMMSSLRDMAEVGVLRCLTPAARQSRLYWLSERGVRLQRTLRRHEDREVLLHDAPELNWEQYAYVCFSHRAAICAVLGEPLHPATIKRRARQRYPFLRMSANNVRDAIRLLRARAIVQPTHLPKERHPRYELTEGCQAFPRLLSRVVWRRESRNEREAA